MPTPGPPTAPRPPWRGSVFFIPWDDEGKDHKPVVIISNNARNTKLDDVLVARITTTPSKFDFPTHVPLSREDGDGDLVGTVRCDDIFPVFKHELIRHAGNLSPKTMIAVTHALRHALALALGAEIEEPIALHQAYPEVAR